jgi:hypothetical protein
LPVVKVLRRAESGAKFYRLPAAVADTPAKKETKAGLDNCPTDSMNQAEVESSEKIRSKAHALRRVYSERYGKPLEYIRPSQVLAGLFHRIVR